VIEPTASDSSNNHRNLQLELKTLRQILRLAKYPIKAYDGEPLGRSLTNAIIPEIERCQVLLSELLSKMQVTWVGLMCTLISSLWRQVFREQWLGDEHASWKRRLNNSQNSLAMIFVALNSYVRFVSQASSDSSLTEIAKYCTDRAWQRIEDRLRIPQKVLRVVTGPTTLPASYSSAHSECSGSFGATSTCADIVLFHVAGMLCFDSACL
jgi:hypothetical protein